MLDAFARGYYPILAVKRGVLRPNSAQAALTYNLHTMRKTLYTLLLAAISALCAFASDIPLVGVWKLNPAKSHFSHGDLPLSLVLTITADGPDGIAYSSKNHLVNGSSGGASFQAKFDGKDYPVTGTPSYNMVSLRRINSNTFNVKMKKGADVIVDTTYTVAPDGKSLTRKGTANHGPNDVNQFNEWFDRQ